MTSKTFKSIDDTRKVHVKPLGTNVVLSIEWQGEMRLGMTLASTEIPALMLALGEAAGYRDYVGSGDDLGLAVENLDKHLAWIEKHAAEAKAQAELESEAVSLFNAYDNVPQKMSEPSLESFEGMPRFVTDRWLAVARKAREMRAEK